MTLTLTKVDPVEDEEGILSATGRKVLGDYARAWLAGKRDLDLERAWPEMEGRFYSVRCENDFARSWAAHSEEPKNAGPVLRQLTINPDGPG